MSSQYEKIIERPSGRGKLYDGGEFFCEVTYQLTVTQTIHVTQTNAGAVETEGLKDSYGFVRAAEPHALFARADHTLTLRLADGRALDVNVTNADGAVQGSGDFTVPSSRT